MRRKQARLSSASYALRLWIVCFSHLKIADFYPHQEMLEVKRPDAKFKKFIDRESLLLAEIQFSDLKQFAEVEIGKLGFSGGVFLLRREPQKLSFL